MTDLNELIARLEKSPTAAVDVLDEITAALHAARADRDVLDDIACGLGCKDDWGSDELEWIAEAVGRVRPSPGGADDYAAVFTEATGRAAPITE